MFKTISGYHILKLLEKSPHHVELLRFSKSSAESLGIPKRLRRAKIKEYGGLDIEGMKEKGKLIIEEELLRYINFPSMSAPHIVVKEDQVVATVLSNPLTVGELRFKISQLPAQIKRRFENKYTREAAVRCLLTNDVLYWDKQRREKERLLIEKLLWTDIGNERNDTIEALKKLNATSSPVVVDKRNQRSSVEVNSEILAAMTIIGLDRPKNSTILATFDGGGITVGRFREAVDNLPLQTQEHMHDLEKRRAFLKYVIFSEFLPIFDNTPRLKINEDILKKIVFCPTSNRYFDKEESITFAEIKEMKTPDCAEPIATFGEIILTIEQLENHVSQMSETQKILFNDSNNSATIVAELLIEKAWLKEAHKLKLTGRYDLEMKEWLMTEKLYRDIVDEVSIADDEIDQYFAHSKFKEEEMDRIGENVKRECALAMKQDEVFRDFLQQLKTKSKITLDKDRLAKWGL